MRTLKSRFNVLHSSSLFPDPPSVSLHLFVPGHIDKVTRLTYPQLIMKTLVTIGSFKRTNLATPISNKDTASGEAFPRRRKEVVREGEDLEMLCAVDASPAATDVLWMYEVKKAGEMELPVL